MHPFSCTSFKVWICCNHGFTVNLMVSKVTAPANLYGNLPVQILCNHSTHSDLSMIRKTLEVLLTKYIIRDQCRPFRHCQVYYSRCKPILNVMLMANSCVISENWWVGKGFYLFHPLLHFKAADDLQPIHMNYSDNRLHVNFQCFFYGNNS